MKPRIKAYSATYKEWVKTHKFSVFWGYYEIIGSFKIWRPNKDINMSADEQYTQNKLNYPGFNSFDAAFMSKMHPWSLG